MTFSVKLDNAKRKLAVQIQIQNLLLSLPKEASTTDILLEMLVVSTSFCESKQTSEQKCVELLRLLQTQADTGLPVPSIALHLYGSSTKATRHRARGLIYYVSRKKQKLFVTKGMWRIL